MLKILLICCLSAGIFTSTECGFLKNIFHHDSTTTTSTTTEPPTTTANTRTIYISNNIPKVEVGCTIHFECKKKLKDVSPPKPCVKYCIKYLSCSEGRVKVRGEPHQCVELDEQLVRREYHETTASNTAHIMQVAMIDFPCQPGYLPDSRGRCREVW